MREFVQHHVAAIARVGRAGEDLGPGQDDLPLRPRFTRQGLRQLGHHAAGQHLPALHDERLRVHEYLAQLRVTLGPALPSSSRQACAAMVTRNSSSMAWPWQPMKGLSATKTWIKPCSRVRSASGKRAASGTRRCRMCVQARGKGLARSRSWRHRLHRGWASSAASPVPTSSARVANGQMACDAVAFTADRWARRARLQATC